MANAGREGGIQYINYMSATLEDIKKVIHCVEVGKKKPDMNKQSLSTLLYFFCILFYFFVTTDFV